MSHFTVMVIGDNPEKQLAPFNEQPEEGSPFLIFKDKTDEYLKEYETGTTKKFYCNSCSSWGQHITKELFDLLKSKKIGFNTVYKANKIELMQYFKNNAEYKGYYTNEGGSRSKGSQWFKVVSINKTTHPDKNVCVEGEITVQKIAEPKKISFKDRYGSFESFAKNYHGVDPNEDGKFGYYHNPNSKWDWYQLGGRWSGLIKLKDGANGLVGESGTFNNPTGIDQAKKSDITNLDELSTFAVLKDGEWFEKGEMGWWGMVSNPKDDEEWETQFKSLLSSLSEDTLISIYDCHI